ncbi:hypothetical protein KFU94_11360 [Chloroflexi bacterium TSY]|nr:hypothetical protein [Chloroflexi bacterium TSY]
MPALETAFLSFTFFMVSLLILIWLSLQISRHILLATYGLTQSKDIANVVLFLVLLPGIIIHEAAHWVTARLLGLKAGKFRVWPKKRGKYLGLGSVTVQSGGIWLDSVVGLAPILIGSTLIVLISHNIFNAYEVTNALEQGRWQTALEEFIVALRRADGPLWAYGLFAIGNAMMPSASDREPVKILLLYVAVAALLYFFVGLPLAPVGSAFVWLASSVQDLSSAFFFIILIDLLVLAPLLMLQAIFPVRAI